MSSTKAQPGATTCQQIQNDSQRTECSYDQEIGLFQCPNANCGATIEIPRCTKDMRCPECCEVAVRDYFTFARVVSVHWLMGQTTGCLPTRGPALNSTRPWIRDPDEPDLLLQSIQTDLEERKRNFGEDDEVMLITRQTSSSSILFDVQCCSKDSVDSVASAVPDSKKAIKKESLCKLCMDQKPDIVFRPCNHGGLCESCMRQMMSDAGQRTCPWCRQPVHRVLKFDAKSSTVAKARVLDV